MKFILSKFVSQNILRKVVVCKKTENDPEQTGMAWNYPEITPELPLVWVTDESGRYFLHISYAVILLYILLYYYTFCYTIIHCYTYTNISYTVKLKETIT